MTVPSPGPLPRVVVQRFGAQRLRDGLPWVFRPDVEQPPPPFEPGVIPCVDVVDAKGNAGASALWAGTGAIALRRWGPAGTACTPQSIAARVHHALALRKAMLPGINACRLIHGEADDLPGLFVDRYGDALVVQCSCSAAELMRPHALAVLQATFSPNLVVQRDDGSARDMESLPRVAGVLSGGPSTRVLYQEGDVTLEGELLTGHKTGSYLDQRDNHILAGQLAHGHCLDLFSNEGGFGLHMARKALHVLCVEQDPACVDRIMGNARHNGLENRVEARAANAFDVVRELDNARQRFDNIVVDPPALAKRQGPVETALKGYFELNRRAFRLASPGAFIHTYSCSGRVTEDMFVTMVMEAAKHAKTRAQVLMHRSAGPDHPGLLGMPEAEYLKGLVLRVEG